MMLWKNINKGLLLLLLSVFANFVAPTLGCQMQKILDQSIYAKQAIIFFMIYFTINFTSQDVESPITQLYRSLLLYVYFLLMNRMDLQFTVLILLSILSIYVINNFIDYHTQGNKNNADTKETTDTMIQKPEEKLKYANTLQRMKTIQNILIYINVAILFVGVFRYYFRQKQQHSNFSNMTFLFGKTLCSRR